MPKIIAIELRHNEFPNDLIVLDSDGNEHQLGIAWGAGYWVRVKDDLLARGVEDTDRILPWNLIDCYTRD